MSERNLFVTDFDYVFLEADAIRTLNILIKVAEKYNIAILQLTENLDGQIQGQLLNLTEHMNIVKGQIQKMVAENDLLYQKYLQDLDIADDFIY